MQHKRTLADVYHALIAQYPQHAEALKADLKRKWERLYLAKSG